MQSILKKHKDEAAKAKAVDPEKQKFINELTSTGADPKKDLPDIEKDVRTGMPPTTPQREYTQRKKSPGRPKGSTNRPKSPAREAVPPAAAPKTPEQVVEELGRARLIKKLRAYKKFFPHIVGHGLDAFDPHAASVQQLKAVVDGCKDAIGDEFTMTMVPDSMTSVLDKIETAAVTIGRQSNDPKLKHLILLRGFAKAARTDPAVAGDLMLIGIDIMALIPSNPYLRLAVNLARVIGSTYEANLLGTTSTSSTPDPNDTRFKEF